jgi:uncharacterized protein YaaN involved in tellurite resistance
LSIEKIKQNIDMARIQDFGKANIARTKEYTNRVLEGIKGKDLNEIGETIAHLSSTIEDFSGKITKKPKGFIGKIFSSVKKQTVEIMAKYSSMDTVLNKIEQELDDKSEILKNDINLLDTFVKNCEKNYGEYEVLINKGYDEIKTYRESINGLEITPKNKNEIQSINNYCEEFEKKLMNLEMNTAVLNTLIPQIRLIQKNNTDLSLQIENAVTTIIPVWQQEIIQAVTLLHSENAAKLYDNVAKTTNKLIRYNADMVNKTSLEIAEMNNKTIIDVETIRYSENKLIETLNGMKRIVDDGKAKRKQVLIDLRKNETDIQKKLLEQIKNEMK